MGSEFGTFQIILSSLILLAAVAAIIGVRRALKGLKKKMPKVDVNRVGASARWIIFALAFLMILSIFEFPLTAIVATIGTLCGVVAIGFVANWSILCNFPCTVFLVATRPFNVGDELEIPADKIRGEVVDISLAYTVLRDSEDFYINIPNAQFLQKQFRRRPGHSGVTLGEQLRKPLPAGEGAGDGDKSVPPQTKPA
ncbi:MAG: mechanosensitive ion channel [Verrucomicrobiae bacterium]|jgi:small-conductance mechanosensitive channel|nr:mechanosensitive ion channel [Verrucomicrobiae bacterium]